MTNVVFYVMDSILYVSIIYITSPKENYHSSPKLSLKNDMDMLHLHRQYQSDLSLGDAVNQMNQVIYFTKAVTSNLAKSPLKFSGGLAKFVSY